MLLHVPPTTFLFAFTLRHVVSLGILALSLASSLDAASLPDQFILKQWNVAQGLPQSTVRCITQTQDGYLWIGTWNGLARFDGIRMKSYTAANTPELHVNIMSIHQDRDGRLWIGTDGGGLAQYQNGSFARFDSSNGIPATRILDIDEDTAGRSWFATEVGIFVHDRGRFLYFTSAHAPIPSYADQILHLPDGRMLLGFVNRGCIVRLTGDSLIVEDSFRTQGRMGVDDAGAVWFGISGAGLIRRIGGVETIDPTYSLSGPVRSVFMRGGEQWLFGTTGVTRRTRTSESEIRTVDDVELSGITDIHEDREGNIWLGKEGGGILRLRPRLARMITTEDGLASSQVMTGLEDSRGTVWIGTFSGGLDRRIRGASKFESFGALPGGISVMALCETRDGTIWVGTWGKGLFAIRDGSMMNVSSESISSGSTVVGLAEDLRSGIWVLTAHDGVVHIDGTTEKHWTTVNGLSENRSSSILVARDGSVWLGTSGGGVNRILNDSVTVFRKEDGLLDNFAGIVREDDEGGIWINFKTGIQRWKNGDLSTVMYDNLLQDDVAQMIQDDKGNFWYGGTRGIHKVGKKQLLDVADGRATELDILTIGNEEGVLLEDFGGGNNTRTWKTRSGMLWFSTTAGAVRVDPRAVVPNRVPPGVVIEEVLIDHGVAPSTRAVTLQPGQTHLEFRYTGLSLSAPQKVQFSYTLEGLDERWNDAGSTRFVQYTNLHPGSYVFRLKAVNSTGVWSEVGASVEVTVIPFLWETRWFRISVSVLVLAGVGLSARFVVTRRVKERFRMLEQAAAVERERVRIASDMHDDLGARMTKISILLGMAERESKNRRSIGGRLRDLSSATRDVERAMDEIIWSVNPKYDSVESLFIYIQQYAQEFLEPTEIRLRFDLPARVPDRPLTADERHTFFSIVKEALNNSVKHAEATEIRVKAEAENGRILIAISDNGVGFDVGSTPMFRHGLDSMRNRMTALRGTCDISSRKGKGTTVRIEVP